MLSEDPPIAIAVLGFDVNWEYLLGLVIWMLSRFKNGSDDFVLLEDEDDELDDEAFSAAAISESIPH